MLKHSLVLSLITGILIVSVNFAVSVEAKAPKAVEEVVESSSSILEEMKSTESSQQDAQKLLSCGCKKKKKHSHRGVLACGEDSSPEEVETPKILEKSGTPTNA